MYKPEHISDSLWLHHGDVVVCVYDRGVLAVVPGLVRAPDINIKLSSATFVGNHSSHLTPLLEQKGFLLAGTDTSTGPRDSTRARLSFCKCTYTHYD